MHCPTCLTCPTCPTCPTSLAAAKLQRSRAAMLPVACRGRHDFPYSPILSHTLSYFPIFSHAAIYRSARVCGGGGMHCPTCPTCPTSLVAAKLQRSRAATHFVACKLPPGNGGAYAVRWHKKTPGFGNCFPNPGVRFAIKLIRRQPPDQLSNFDYPITAAIE